MKVFVFLLFLAGHSQEITANVEGIDVSVFQGNVNWGNVKKSGKYFAYIKATEGTTYKSPEFTSQYTGAAKEGLIRGAYHFAYPDKSTGASQANYFLKNGGGWSADGKTLPGTLDVEYNPDGKPCYGLSQSAMVAWIQDFSRTYQKATNRYPVIYTTTDWWKRCTGNSNQFASSNPLWIARYGSDIGTLPAGWSHATIWQDSDKTDVPGDHDIFLGDLNGLKKFAGN